MANQAVKIFFVGMVTLAVIQGIAGLKCWSGSKVGDTIISRNEIDCTALGQTKCLTYDMTALTNIKTITWFCGTCSTSTWQNCKTCDTDLCNNAKTISANTLTVVVIFAVYKLLQGWMTS